MALQNVDELTRLRSRFRKMPLAHTRGSVVLDLVEDVVEPALVVALGLAVIALGLAWFVWHLLGAAIDMAPDAVWPLG